MEDPTLLSRPIKAGDLVIVDEGDKLTQVYVKPDGVLQNRYGAFRHSAWIGKPFGHRAVATDGGGFVHALAPTPELWSLSLSHRTQILYMADGRVADRRAPRPRPGCHRNRGGHGQRLAVALARGRRRSVGPSLHLRVQPAQVRGGGEGVPRQRVRARAGQLRHADVCEPEWSFKPSLQTPVRGGEALAGAGADAAIFDVPSPWLVVPAAREALRPGGHFCSFSPCIEQIERTAAALSRHRFSCVRVFECLTFKRHLAAVRAADEAPRGGSRPKVRAPYAGAAGDGRSGANAPSVAGRKRRREGEGHGERHAETGYIQATPYATYKLRLLLAPAQPRAPASDGKCKRGIGFTAAHLCCLTRARHVTSKGCCLLRRLTKSCCAVALQSTPLRRLEPSLSMLEGVDGDRCWREPRADWLGDEHARAGVLGSFTSEYIMAHRASVGKHAAGRVPPATDRSCGGLSVGIARAAGSRDGDAPLAQR
jgi:tRNA (adenine57-N1/adenine58-N1)-methyltransferase